MPAAFCQLLIESKAVAYPLWSAAISLFLPARWLLYHSVGATEAPFLLLVFLSMLAYLRGHYAAAFLLAGTVGHHANRRSFPRPCLSAHAAAGEKVEQSSIACPCCHSCPPAFHFLQPPVRRFLGLFLGERTAAAVGLVVLAYIYVWGLLPHNVVTEESWRKLLEAL